MECLHDLILDYSRRFRPRGADAQPARQSARNRGMPARARSGGGADRDRVLERRDAAGQAGRELCRIARGERHRACAGAGTHHRGRRCRIYRARGDRRQRVQCQKNATPPGADGARHAGRAGFSRASHRRRIAPGRAPGAGARSGGCRERRQTGRRAQGGNVRRRRGRSRAGAAAGGRRPGSRASRSSSCSRCCRCCRNRRRMSRRRSEALGTAALEWKIDGARVQVHKRATTCASTRAISTTSLNACRK